MSNSQLKVTLEKHAYILFSLSQCYFYELARVVLSLWVGSGRQAVMLQGFIISGWERCPFATMASSVFHASCSRFQALQPSAAGGQSCVLCSHRSGTRRPWGWDWAAAQVVSSSSAPSGKGFSGTCLCKTLWSNVGKQIFLQKQGGGTSGFS